MERQKLVLEPSTNTHVLEGKKVLLKKKIGSMGTMVFEAHGAKVVHGEHAVVQVGNNSPNIIKITQQEYNPITKKLMNAFD